MKSKSPRIIKLVESGIPDKEIMAKLGIKSKTTLHKKYYNALVESGMVQSIAKKDSRRGRKVDDKVITIGKTETILIGKSTVTKQFGFKQGDKFRVSKTKVGISLKKV